MELVLIEAEVNQLEAIISETRREISQGPYKHLADAARSNELVDAAEEWVWQSPEAGYRLGEYREKTAALREELEKVQRCPSLFGLTNFSERNALQRKR